MVRVKLPCFSIEAHGSIARGIIFATNLYGQYLKFFIPKPKPATPAQSKVRHAYGQIATAWRFMTPEQKEVYHKKAVIARHTDYNQFFEEKWEQVYNPPPPTPLQIKDLENAHITTTRSSYEIGWVFAFIGNVPEEYEFGTVYDNRNIFDDIDIAPDFCPVRIEIIHSEGPMLIQSGDTLEITYDDGQGLIIYLPKITEDYTTLYLADDGSTYYDEALTQIAQKAPLI